MEKGRACRRVGGDCAGQPLGRRDPRQHRRNRAEVGDTVEALAEKTDVKGQAQQRVPRSGRLDLKREDLMPKARSSNPQSAQEGGQQVVAKAEENRDAARHRRRGIAGVLVRRRTGRPCTRSSRRSAWHSGSARTDLEEDLRFRLGPRGRRGRRAQAPGDPAAQAADRAPGGGRNRRVVRGFVVTARGVAGRG